MATGICCDKIGISLLGQGSSASSRPSAGRATGGFCSGYLAWWCVLEYCQKNFYRPLIYSAGVSTVGEKSGLAFLASLRMT